jgi:ferric-dicitrate binding protein FerR (iron transport regulator)
MSFLPSSPPRSSSPPNREHSGNAGLHRRVFVASLAATCLSVRSACAADATGKVETSRGDCYALSAAVRRALAPASEVFVGDAVATGEQSALGLQLGAATQVRLGPDARLRIDRYLINAGGTLVLDRGGMLYDHDAKSVPSDVTVRSPFGLVAVRGTRFFAGPSNGMFGVFVERSAVTVVGVNTAVQVTSGLGSHIERPGAEPSEPAPWGAARIAAALASVR